ncbi:MAG: DUF11 domain-containing protein, partial [Saprospiraceae bacterium]|nr:DUF11 domain-containing protein [Saprospiraceae bacterium]
MPGTLVVSPEADDFGGLIHPGDCEDAMVSVMLGPDAVFGETFTNTAMIDLSGIITGGASTGGPVITTNGTVTATGLVGPYLPDADMAVTKTLVSGPLVPGTVETFVITVSNLGPAPAEAVFVVEQFFLGAGIDLVGITLPASDWALSEGFTFIRLNPMPAGLTETITVDVRIPSDAHYQDLPFPFNNGAFVSASNPDPDTMNNFAISAAPFTGLPAVLSATFTVTKTLLSPSVSPGGLALFEIIVCNEGPSDADGMSITDTVGLNLVPGSLILSADVDDLYLVAGLCVDVFGTAQVSPTAAIGDIFSNTAEVDPTGIILGAPSVFSASLLLPPPSTVTGTVGEYLPDADMVVTATLSTPDGKLPIGDDVQFVISVTNRGPAPAEQVIVTNFLTAVAPQYLGLTASSGDWAAGSSGLTIVRQSTMPAGATEVITLSIGIPANAHMVAEGLIEFGSYVVAANPDPEPGNNLDVIETPLKLLVDLTLDKQLLTPKVPPGGTALWEVVVCNEGDGDLAGVAITDLPGFNL